MIRLSIIIPIYNGSRFIPRIIRSLYDQDIPEEEYEVIFIDDCSSDNSYELLREIRQEHSNICVLHHQCNQRLASTCNTGLDFAHGEYVWVIDQDDWISNNSIGSLLNVAELNALDLLLFNYGRVNEDGLLLQKPYMFKDSPVMSGRSFIDQHFGNSFDYYLLGYRWRALFNLSYLKKRNIRFPDGMMYDDTTILLKAIYYAKRVSSVKEIGYYYVQTEGSITQRKIPKGKLIFEYSFLVGQEVLGFAELTFSDRAFSDTLISRVSKYNNGFVIPILKTTIEERRLFYEEVAKNRQIVKKTYDYLNSKSKMLLVPYVGECCAFVLSLIYKLLHFSNNG